MNSGAVDEIPTTTFGYTKKKLGKFFFPIERH